MSEDRPDAHLDAVIAFWDTWRAYSKLPEDERSGVAIGEVMAVLARDPQFILAAADDLLDEAMLHTRAKLHMDVSGEPCGSVRDAYAKLKAARNAR